MAVKKREPWKALDPYRGKEFTTEWPTFPQLIKINVERFGNNPCFTDFEGENGAKQTLTYNQVYEKIQNVAKWLIENGIQKGDHVAVTGKNSPEWLPSHRACSARKWATPQPSAYPRERFAWRLPASITTSDYADFPPQC